MRRGELLHYNGVDCTDSRSLVSSQLGHKECTQGNFFFFFFLDLPSAGGNFPHFGDPALHLAFKEKLNKKGNRTKPSQSYRHVASSVQSSSSIFFLKTSHCSFDRLLFVHKTCPRTQNKVLPTATVDNTIRNNVGDGNSQSFFKQK